MSKLRKNALIKGLLVVSIVSNLNGAHSFAQSASVSNDAEQIRALIADLSDQKRTPQQALDPALSASERKTSLNHFSNEHYELSITTRADITISANGTTGSAPIHVHYKADDGNSLDADATAQFVQRNGTWYFSSFDFMGWPALLIGVFVLCLLCGITYAITVLVLRRRLLRRGPLGSSAVKMFLPIFWPSLFRQTR